MVRENRINGPEGFGEHLPPQEIIKLTVRVIALTGPLRSFTESDLSKVKDKAEMKRSLIKLISDCDQDILPNLSQVENTKIKGMFQKAYDSAKERLSELEKDEKKN